MWVFARLSVCRFLWYILFPLLLLRLIYVRCILYMDTF